MEKYIIIIIIVWVLQKSNKIYLHIFKCHLNTSLVESEGLNQLQPYPGWII